MKINRIMHVECLLNNYLTEEFTSALKPFTVTQTLCLIPQFNITNGFITPNNKTSYIKSFFGASSFLLIIIYRVLVIVDNDKISAIPDSIFWMTIADSVISIIATILTYTVALLQSQNVVVIMLRLHRALNIIGKDQHTILANHKMYSWLAVIALLFYYIISLAIVLLSSIEILSLKIVLHLISVSRLISIISDLNMIYLVRTVALISNILASLNNKILLYKKTHSDGNQDIEDEEVLNNFHHLYQDIIKAFGLLKSVYGPLVSALVVNFMCVCILMCCELINR